MPSSRVVFQNLDLDLDLDEQLHLSRSKLKSDSAFELAKAELRLVKPSLSVSLPLWDLPIRVFHWSLVIAVVVAIVSAKVGGEWMVLHGKAGLTILGLLSFRLVWGFVGTRHARFVNFFPTVSSIRTYLQGKWQGRGHNPLGAVSVLLLLSLLLLQAGGGLFTDDEISFTGPLAHVIDTEVVVKLTGWHHQLSSVLIAFLILHLLAIIFYRLFKKKNLLTPMINGVEQVPVAQVAHDTSTKSVSLWALFFSVAFAVVLTYAASIGFGTQLIQTSSATQGNTPGDTQPAAKEVTPAPAW